MTTLWQRAVDTTGHLSTTLLVVVAVAACSTAPAVTLAPVPSPTPTPEAYVVTGTLHLAGSNQVDITTSCAGTEGYDDLRPGLDVTVKDQSGTLIAKGALGAGVFDGASGPALPGVGVGECTWPFSIGGVPRATFYSVEVGHRGALTYSFSELAGRGWRVGFELGN